MRIRHLPICLIIIILNFSFALSSVAQNCSFQTIYSVIDVRCNGGNSGAITSNVSGTSGPYMFQWSTGSNSSGTVGLTAGQYMVTITDAMGCSEYDTVTVSEPPALSYTTTVTDLSCFGSCDGEVVVHASGGTPPYIYGDHPDSIAVDLCAGSELFVLRDANNCLNSGMITVPQPAAISLSITKNASTCDMPNGNAAVTASNGFSPYEYSWTSGSTDASADSLEAGLYMVTVQDANGCEQFKVVLISDSDGPVVTTNNVTNVSCHGAMDGAIDINASGNGPLTFQWSKGDMTEDISGLSGGPYEVHVTDTFGCKGVMGFYVQAPDEIDVDYNINKASCGNSDGSISLNVSGGNNPYTYNWSVLAVGATANNLGFGLYEVTVTDMDGCAKEVILGMPETGGPDVDIAEIEAVVCGGFGSMDVEASGGQPPYNYLWSNGSTTEDISGVEPGLYGVVVTDSIGCHGVNGDVIPAIGPEMPVICMVTVDSATNRNICVFQKDTLALAVIDHANFYKESTESGNYYFIGSKTIDQLSQWADPGSPPGERAWRYKLSLVDTCGNESAISRAHKTIHIVGLRGPGGTVRLVWDQYDGFDHPYFFIERHLPSTGWVVLDSVNSGNMFIDQPPNIDLANYRIRINPPEVCTAVRAVSHNSSRSNITNMAPQDTADIEDTSGIFIQEIPKLLWPVTYPNPASEALNIEFAAASGGNYEISLFNALGLEVKRKRYFNGDGSARHLDLENISAGMYFLRIQHLELNGVKTTQMLVVPKE